LAYLTVLSIYAYGNYETRFGKYLEKNHNIASIPVNERPVFDYVITKNDTLIFHSAGQKLVEYNFLTKEKRGIPIPPEFNKLVFGHMTYDSKKNAIYMLAGKHLRYLFYVLYLDDYTWEEIPQLSDLFGIPPYYYNSDKNILYFQEFIDEEGIVTAFDMEKEEVIERIYLPDDVKLIKNGSIIGMYGYPLQILAAISFEDDSSNTIYYYLFDTESKEGKVFQRIKDANSDFLGLKQYIPLEEYCFLGINWSTGKEIIKLNLLEGSYTILESFSHHINGLERIDDNKYSFIIEADHLLSFPSFGGDVWHLLCFWEYRQAHSAEYYYPQSCPKTVLVNSGAEP
jgi:hypothetical protein